MPDMRTQVGGNPNGQSLGDSVAQPGGGPAAPGPTTPAVASGVDNPAPGPDMAGVDTPTPSLGDQTPAIGPRRGLGSFWAGSMDAGD